MGKIFLIRKGPLGRALAQQHTAASSSRHSHPPCKGQKAAEDKRLEAELVASLRPEAPKASTEDHQVIKEEQEDSEEDQAESEEPCLLPSARAKQAKSHSCRQHKLKKREKGKRGEGRGRGRGRQAGATRTPVASAAASAVGDGASSVAGSKSVRSGKLSPREKVLANAESWPQRLSVSQMLESKAFGNLAWQARQTLASLEATNASDEQTLFLKHHLELCRMAEDSAG